MTNKKQNTINLKDVYTLSELMKFKEFSHMKTPDLISFLVSKGASKLVLEGQFQGAIVFLKSEVNELLKTL